MQELSQESALWQENKKRLARKQQSTEAALKTVSAKDQATTEKTPSTSKAPRGFY